MFNAFRRPDSTSLWIEFIDTAINDKEYARELYDTISKTLVEEYLKEKGPALLAQINESVIVNNLAALIAKSLVRSIKEENTNG